MKNWRHYLESIVTPFLAFAGLYFGSLLLLSLVALPFLAGPERQTVGQWIALGCGIAANALCVRWLDRGRFDLGLVRPLSGIAAGLMKGCLVALVLVCGTDALIIATTGFRHLGGTGIDWPELLLLFIPAAIGEELVFRGYVLQRLARSSFIGSMLFTSFLFAAAHVGNSSVGNLALLNIFLAGILLALAWRWTRSLWVPIGTHIAWNILSGPVLGHEVSGFVLPRTLLSTVDPGPDLLTGGAFGIEASVWMTVAEIATIAFLALRIRRDEPPLSERSLVASIARAAPPSPASPAIQDTAVSREEFESTNTEN